MGSKWGAYIRSGEQLLHVGEDAVVFAALETRCTEVVDERVPFVREYRNPDRRVACVGEERRNVRANEARLLDDREHGQALVQGKRRGGGGEDVNGCEVVKALHPGRHGGSEGFYASEGGG